MTMTEKKKTADENGLTIHIFRTGLTYPRAGGEFGGHSEVGRRGQVIDLTPQDVEASRDRAGNSLWSLSPQEQRDRWGEQRFGIGPWPDGEDVFVRGSVEWAEAREAARREAWQAPASQRRAALADVEEKFGPAPVTSKTLERVVGDEERDEILRSAGLYYADEK